LFGQRDIARQHGLLHQEQHSGRDGNGLVVAEHDQQNQRKFKTNLFHLSPKIKSPSVLAPHAKSLALRVKFAVLARLIGLCGIFRPSQWQLANSFCLCVFCGSRAIQAFISRLRSALVTSSARNLRPRIRPNR